MRCDAGRKQLIAFGCKILRSDPYERAYHDGLFKLSVGKDLFRKPFVLMSVASRSNRRVRFMRSSPFTRGGMDLHHRTESVVNLVVAELARIPVGKELSHA